jgi:hypothetical protein
VTTRLLLLRRRIETETEARLTYLAFIPGQCAHCGADFNAHIPSGERDVYYCPEWALREKWGDR